MTPPEPAPSPAAPTIHVVDDDEAVTLSLVFLLETGGFKARAYASGTELLARGPELEPGLILLDVRMPEIDGISVLERLRERGVSLPVIIMTGHADVPLAVRAMKAGAADFIEKPFTDEVLFSMLRETLARHAPRANGADPALREKFAALTPRERDVLRGLLAGLPNKTIAYDLGISPRTVEIHRAHLMEKVGARNLSSLIRLALSAGFTAEGEAG
jgi:two-component system response regulator FixJ